MAGKSAEVAVGVDKPPLPARFKHATVNVTGEVGAYDLFYCDPLDVLRELLTNLAFADDLPWKATCCYSSKSRLWTEMTSGDRMWKMLLLNQFISALQAA